MSTWRLQPGRGVGLRPDPCCSSLQAGGHLPRWSLPARRVPARNSKSQAHLPTPTAPFLEQDPSSRVGLLGVGDIEGPTHTDLTLLLLGTISSAATTESISAGLTDTILLL